ncbi:MAG TPA: hypothetical protein VK027_05440 [Chitinophagaceae bacterium]|nr:hypothetical protein [Chitinophagaceae bacterium]
MKKLIIFSFSALLLFSCTEQQTKEEVIEKQIEENEILLEEEKPSAKEISEKQESISLNNGERWEVNEEMKPYVNEAESILKNYQNTEDNNYQQLAIDLKEQNDALIKSCTMDGTAHDELHNWLHPHLQLVEGLKNAKNIEESQEWLEQLNLSMEKYHKYFK